MKHWSCWRPTAWREASITTTPTGLAADAHPSFPRPQANLTATPISGSQINLTWQNNASNNTGIEIDRSTDGMTFSPLTTLGPGTTSFSDITALGSTKYYYQVLATNGTGKSTPSNIANATTYPTGESLVYLSDIPWVAPPASARCSSIRRSKDNPITLRGTTYAKGIGTHAASTITYNLAGQYETFTSDIGIDDEVNGLGSVDFQIIGDGKVLFDSGTITGSSPVVHVNISVDRRAAVAACRDEHRPRQHRLRPCGLGRSESADGADCLMTNDQIRMTNQCPTTI